jgi:hypothetical protein
MYLLIVLFIIWLIIKIWMNEIFLMSDLCVDLLCTNILVFTWFCNCKLSKNRKCCLPNRVNTQIWIWIRDIRFVFKFVVVFLSKNVVKGVIQIQFHVNSFCFHPYEGGREGGKDTPWIFMCAMFVCIISHQVTILFSQNKSALTTSHQPTEQTAGWWTYR